MDLVWVWIVGLGGFAIVWVLGLGIGVCLDWIDWVVCVFSSSWLGVDWCGVVWFGSSRVGCVWADLIWLCLLGWVGLGYLGRWCAFFFPFPFWGRGWNGYGTEEERRERVDWVGGIFLSWREGENGRIGK